MRFRTQLAIVVATEALVYAVSALAGLAYRWPGAIISGFVVAMCMKDESRDKTTSAYLETERHSRTLLLASGLPQGEVSEALTRMRTQAGFGASVVMQARWVELGRQLEGMRK